MAVNDCFGPCFELDGFELNLKLCDCADGGDIECTDCGLRTNICFDWDRVDHTNSTYAAPGGVTNNYVVIDPTQSRQQGALNNLTLELCNPRCDGGPRNAMINVQGALVVTAGMEPSNNTGLNDVVSPTDTRFTQYLIKLEHRQSCDGGAWSNWIDVQSNYIEEKIWGPDRRTIMVDHQFSDSVPPESCCEWQFRWNIEVTNNSQLALRLERNTIRADGHMFGMNRCVFTG